MGLLTSYGMMTNWSGDPWFDTREVAPHVEETRWSGFKSPCPHLSKSLILMTLELCSDIFLRKMVTLCGIVDSAGLLEKRSFSAGPRALIVLFTINYLTTDHVISDRKYPLYKMDSFPKFILQNFLYTHHIIKRYNLLKEVSVKRC